MTERYRRIQIVDLRPSQATARESPIRINEILDRIFSFLDQRMLKSVAARVCSQWLHVAARRFQTHLFVSLDDSKTWKDLSKRLSRANVLTVGAPIRRNQVPGRSINWHQVASQLEEILLEHYINDKHSRKERDSAIPPLVSLSISRLRANNDRKGVGQDKGAHSQMTKLILNLEFWFGNQEMTLALWCPHTATTLRELTMDVPYTTSFISVESILNQFPNLLHLSISSYKQTNILRVQSQRDCPQLQPHSAPIVDRGYDFLEHPLRSLFLDCICLTPAAVGSYFPRLGNLIEIRLLDIRLPSGGWLSFHNSGDENQGFWESLSNHCPKLESIHFQMNQPQGGVVPVELFPRVHEWCFGYHHGTVNSMLQKLTVHIVENRLTTLNINSTQILTGSFYRAFDHVSDQLLCNLLCASPHLKHLDTGVRDRSTLVLTMPVAALWACRGLLTLSMRFNTRIGGSHSESRHVFGFLSRACPALEELVLHLECDGFSARSGLCLLTRLKRLRRLVVQGFFLDHRNGKTQDWTLSQADFCWIQEGSTARLPSTPGWTDGLSFLFSRVSVSDDKKYYLHSKMDYLDSIQKLREWSRSPTFNGAGMNSFSQLEKDRPMVQQQQKDNGYRTSYDRPIPMVDGMEGLDHSGSFLDIEACLEAQLFRLDQHCSVPKDQLGHPSETESTVMATMAIMGENTKIPNQSTPETISVWPAMEEIRFMHQNGSYTCSSEKSILKYVEQGRKIVQRMRPDIKVLY